MRRQGLFAAGVGGADFLAPPVVVLGVDAVDQQEARLCVIVGRAHDGVPDRGSGFGAVDAAGHGAVGMDEIIVGGARQRVAFEDHAIGRGDIGDSGLGCILAGQREDQAPVGVVLDRVHKAVG